MLPSREPGICSGLRCLPTASMNCVLACSREAFENPGRSPRDQPRTESKMAASFLYDRITERRPQTTGTLAEPNGAPEPRFALQGTVYWMRALAILVADAKIGWTV